MSDCTLRAANGVHDVPCDGEDCIYWRVVGHLGVSKETEGCAIQHFSMLDGDSSVAEWLLSVKDRLESPGADAADPMGADPAEAATE